jgi:hypothetical protein
MFDLFGGILAISFLFIFIGVLLKAWYDYNKPEDKE